MASDLSFDATIKKLKSCDCADLVNIYERGGGDGYSGVLRAAASFVVLGSCAAVFFLRTVAVIPLQSAIARIGRRRSRLTAGGQQIVLP